MDKFPIVASKPASKQTANRLLTGLALVLAAGSANAAAIDVSGVVSDIGANAAPIAAIGSAVLLILVGIMGFKWVRRAL